MEEARSLALAKGLELHPPGSPSWACRAAVCRTYTRTSRQRLALEMVSDIIY